MSSIPPIALMLCLVACDSAGRLGPGTGADLATHPPNDASFVPPVDAAQLGCGATTAGCYTVYAHADHVLYRVDLGAKTLIAIGPFNAPKKGTTEDVITDLAVAPDDTIYVISKTTLYTASPVDGHVTSVGAVTACGNDNVALTTTPDGSLYAGDYKGAFCKIDLNTTPPTVTQIGVLGANLALAGDLVGVGDGTLYGTAYKLNDTATQTDNLLIKIDPTTGTSTQTLGPTGSPQLYGAAYSMGLVFGFTHDGSGNVITIDPATGHGTLFNTFTDPTTHKGISFAGAGVNSMVAVQ